MWQKDNQQSANHLKMVQLCLCVSLKTTVPQVAWGKIHCLQQGTSKRRGEYATE